MSQPFASTNIEFDECSTLCLKKDLKLDLGHYLFYLSRVFFGLAGLFAGSRQARSARSARKVRTNQRQGSFLPEPVFSALRLFLT